MSGQGRRGAAGRRLRNATLVDTLATLQADGRVRIDAGQVQLALA